MIVIKLRIHSPDLHISFPLQVTHRFHFFKPAHKKTVVDFSYLSFIFTVYPGNRPVLFVPGEFIGFYRGHCPGGYRRAGGAGWIISSGLGVYKACESGSQYACKKFLHSCVF